MRYSRLPRVFLSRYMPVVWCVLVVVAGTETLRAQTEAGSLPDTVKVKSIGFARGDSVELYGHQGWIGAAVYECQSSKSSHQVVATMEAWQDGKLVAIERPNGRAVIADAGSDAYDMRASITITQYPDNKLIIRNLMMAADGTTSTGLRVNQIEVRPGTRFTGGGVVESELKPNEEKVIWVLQGAKDDDAQFFERVIGEGRFDLSGKDKADLLVFLKMKLVPWVSK